MVAGGVAYFSLLSLFPALAAGVALFGIVADPRAVTGLMEQAAVFLPPEAATIITDQLVRLTSAGRGALGWGALIALALALWSASRSTMALMAALNIAYGESEKRGFVRLYATGLLLTLGGILFAILSLALVAALPVVIGFLDLPAGLRWAISLVKWPVLAALILAGLAVVYRIVPSRAPARWRWVTPGALAATALWIIGSVGFSIYVGNFGSYNETYGSLGAVVVLMLWMYLSAYVVLLGAELNAEAERQVRPDSTLPPDQPMGERGAWAADTLGDKQV
jgi:membrane protein